MTASTTASMHFAIFLFMDVIFHHIFKQLASVCV